MIKNYVRLHVSERVDQKDCFQYDLTFLVSSVFLRIEDDFLKG